MVTGSLALCAALWSVPILPTNDGPEHVMMGHIENHYDDPGTIYSHYLAPAPQYAGRGFAALYVPLEAVLSWQLAYRLTLAFMLLLWSWGFCALVLALDKSQDKKRRWLGLLGIATAFQWALYMGFFAFVVGSACGLWLMALAVSTARWNAKRLLIIGLGLLLQGFLHVVSALVTGMVIGLVVMAREVGLAARSRAALRFGVACVPLCILFGFTLRDRGVAAGTPYAESTVFVALWEKVHYLHRCFAPGADWRGMVLFGMAALGLGRLIGRRGGSAVEAAIGIAALGLFGVALFGPETLPGWQFFFERFLPLGTVLLVALIDIENWPGRARLIAIVFVCGYSAASVWEAAAVNRKLYARDADVFAGLSQPIHRTGLRLPIVSDPWFALPPRRSPVPGMVPRHSVASLFVAAQGGMIPYMFIDSPSVHEFVGIDAAWNSDFPPRPPADRLQQLAYRDPRDPERLQALDELALDGTAYEDVIVIAAPSDAEAFVGRGYVADYRKGELFMGHYRGCAAELVMPAGMGAQAVEYGFWPNVENVRRLPLTEPMAGPDGEVHVELKGAPCGAAWARVISSNGSGCAGADAQGRLKWSGLEGEKALVRCQP